MKPYDKFEVGDIIKITPTHRSIAYPVIFKIIKKNTLNQYKLELVDRLNEIKYGKIIPVWSYSQSWITLSIKDDVCKKLTEDDIIMEQL